MVPERKKNLVIGVAAILSTLVTLFGYQKFTGNPSQVTPEEVLVVQQEKALSDLQIRIGQLESLRQEKTLTRDILLLQLEIAELNSKTVVKPSPVILE